MIPNYNGFWFLPPPFLPPNCDKPPTIYTILESIVNYDVDLNDPAPIVNIKDLAKQGRSVIFNFDYPLSDYVSRETFETMILNKFLMRRINFDTVTAFRIQLNVKLNEIMPKYNKLFDSLENWNIFQDGEVTTRIGQDAKTTSNTTSDTSTNSSSSSLSNNSTTGDTSTSDRRYSDTPQNQLSNVQDGNYVTEYNYDTNTRTGTDTSTSTGSSQSTTNNSGSSNGSDNTSYNETITRTPGDKIAIMKEMQDNIQNIYTMIFKDLDVLFYGLV